MPKIQGGTFPTLLAATGEKKKGKRGNKGDFEGKELEFFEKWFKKYSLVDRRKKGFWTDFFKAWWIAHPWVPAVKTLQEGVEPTTTLKDASSMSEDPGASTTTSDEPEPSRTTINMTPEEAAKAKLASMEVGVMLGCSIGIELMVFSKAEVLVFQSQDKGKSCVEEPFCQMVEPSEQGQPGPMTKGGAQILYVDAGTFS
ncbi:hypothetical protein C8J56DRAFT_1062776 [Mycena floridula]|nr:hypothetical protein C8J56DRAFT_1062776 [Mycena floridula]